MENVAYGALKHVDSMGEEGIGRRRV